MSDSRDEPCRNHAPETQRADLADPVTGLTGAARILTAVGVVGFVVLLFGYGYVASIQDGRARIKAAEDAHNKVGEMTEAVRTNSTKVDANTAKLDEVARALRALTSRLKELDERKAERPGPE